MYSSTRKENTDANGKKYGYLYTYTCNSTDEIYVGSTMDPKIRKYFHLNS